jgi:hypothetical protein
VPAKYQHPGVGREYLLAGCRGQVDATMARAVRAIGCLKTLGHHWFG